MIIRLLALAGLATPLVALSASVRRRRLRRNSWSIHLWRNL